MPTKIHIEKDRIVDLYIHQDMDQQEVAEELGCSVDTIRNRRREYGIETKNVDAENGRKRYENNGQRDKNTLKKLYLKEKKSGSEIAEELDCGETTVYRWLRKFGIERRTPKEAKTIQRTNYRVNQKGYTLHVSANSGCEKKDIVFTHQLLSCMDNDPFDVFDSSTVVHHENEIPFDNRRENLSVMDRGEHQKLHTRSK